MIASLGLDLCLNCVVVLRIGHKYKTHIFGT